MQTMMVRRLELTPHAETVKSPLLPEALAAFAHCEGGGETDLC